MLCVCGMLIGIFNVVLLFGIVFVLLLLLVFVVLFDWCWVFIVIGVFGFVVVVVWFVLYCDLVCVELFVVECGYFDVDV